MTDNQDNEQSANGLEVAGPLNLSIKCQICFKQMASSNSLRSHMKLHNRPFACPNCTMTYDQEAKLLRHLINFHFSCDRARRGAPLIAAESNDEDAILALILAQNDNIEGDFIFVVEQALQCVSCNEFVTTSNMKRHLTKHLLEIGARCPRAFRFMCDVCGACYQKMNAFEAHMLIHDN